MHSKDAYLHVHLSIVIHFFHCYIYIKGLGVRMSCFTLLSYVPNLINKELGSVESVGINVFALFSLFSGMTSIFLLLPICNI